MRKDSCRRCGLDMEISKKCPVCRESIEFFCHNCRQSTDRQIHSDCIIKEVCISA